jgi:hypothetical protein
MVQSIGCNYITQHASQYHPNSRTNMTNKMIMTTYDKSNSLLTVINKSAATMNFKGWGLLVVEP